MEEKKVLKAFTKCSKLKIKLTFKARAENAHRFVNKAEKLLKGIADAGNAEAMFKLGEIHEAAGDKYRVRIGYEEDATKQYTAAYDLYVRAKAAGYTEAEAPLGKLTKGEDGVVCKEDEITTGDYVDLKRKRFLYHGELKNGVPDGKGEETDTKTGSKYVGDFVKGERHGNGRWTNGYISHSGEYATYEGEFRRGEFNGKGVYDDGVVFVYEGTFKNGLFVEGKRTHEDGVSICIGKFALEQSTKVRNLYALDGEGVRYKDNGRILVGTFKCGNLNLLKGTIFGDNGIIDGEWPGDYDEYEYRVYYPSGMIMKHVHDNTGTHFDHIEPPQMYKAAFDFEGGRYSGESNWSEGRRVPHGIGVLTMPNGDKIDGDWDMGDELVARITKPDGSMEYRVEHNRARKKTGRYEMPESNGYYEGDYLEYDEVSMGKDEYGRTVPMVCAVQLPDGKGVLVKDGHRLEGSFRNGKANGFCKVRYVSGDSYEGEMRYGMRFGKGTYNFASGDWSEGYYASNDEYNVMYHWKNGSKKRCGMVHEQHTIIIV